jgi:hypothetical protein
MNNRRPGYYWVLRNGGAKPEVGLYEGPPVEGLSIEFSNVWQVAGEGMEEGKVRVLSGRLEEPVWNPRPDEVDHLAADYVRWAGLGERGPGAEAELSRRIRALMVR